MQGLSLMVSSYNGEDVLVSFGGYNGRYSNEVMMNSIFLAFSLSLSLSLCFISPFSNVVCYIQVYVLKPSHKSTLQTKIIDPVEDSVSAVLNATNATRDLESEFESGQEGKIREIVMDNVDPESAVCITAKLVYYFLSSFMKNTGPVLMLV